MSQPEIYIVQNEAGDVVDVFRDADEATAAYQEGYTVIEETIWEPGEYASVRIEELTTAWEAATGYTASDHALSAEDWKIGLDDDEAAEIARLMKWQAGSEVRAAQRPTSFFEEHAKEVDPGSLYLRVGIADGTGPDGEEIEFSMAAGGSAFILDVKSADGTRRKQSIRTADLVEAWTEHIRGGESS